MTTTTTPTIRHRDVAEDLNATLLEPDDGLSLPSDEESLRDPEVWVGSSRKDSKSVSETAEGRSTLVPEGLLLALHCTGCGAHEEVLMDVRQGKVPPQSFVSKPIPGADARTEWYARQASKLSRPFAREHRDCEDESIPLPIGEDPFVTDVLERAQTSLQEGFVPPRLFLRGTDGRRVVAPLGVFRDSGSAHRRWLGEVERRKAALRDWMRAHDFTVDRVLFLAEALTGDPGSDTAPVNNPSADDCVLVWTGTPERAAMTVLPIRHQLGVARKRIGVNESEMKPGWDLPLVRGVLVKRWITPESTD